jgi:uncharacterized protein
MYQILLTPLIAGFAAQISKFFIKSNRLKFSWQSITSYSGMPSSHAAITVSLTTTAGLTEGLASPLFAVCLIFTILVIRDALGVRRYIGQHSEILNDLVKDLRQDKISLGEEYPHLVEKIGHTPLQIIAGSALGLAISLIGFLFF